MKRLTKTTITNSNYSRNLDGNRTCVKYSGQIDQSHSIYVFQASETKPKVRNKHTKVKLHTI